MDERAAFTFFTDPVNSKFQEAAAEYRFLEMLLVQAAGCGQKINVCRSDFDAFGYDLLLRLGDVTRLIQLKARSGGTDNDGYWDVHRSLLSSPDSRIVCARLKLVPSLVGAETVADRIQYEFKLFDYLAHATAASQRSPKKAHASKCKVLEREFTPITTNLLALFA